MPALVIRPLNLYTPLSSLSGYICSEPWGNMTQLYRRNMGTLETSHNQLFIGKKRLGVSTEKHHKCARSISIFTSFFFTDLTALKLVAEDTASFYSSLYIHTYIKIYPSKHTCTHIHTPSITLQLLHVQEFYFHLGSWQLSSEQQHLFSCCH